MTDRPTLPEIPEPPAVPDVTPMQTATPEAPEEKKLIGLSPDAMCRVWGRLRSQVYEPGSPMPRDAQSQLRGTKALAQAVEGPRHKTHEEQVAEAVEDCEGFDRPTLWKAYVEGWGLNDDVRAFHASLSATYPNGFRSTPPRVLPTRREEIEAAEREAEALRRKKPVGWRQRRQAIKDEGRLLPGFKRDEQ